MQLTAEQIQAIFDAMIKQLKHSRELNRTMTQRFPRNAKENDYAQTQAYAQCIGTLEGLAAAGLIDDETVDEFWCDASDLEHLWDFS